MFATHERYLNLGGTIRSRSPQATLESVRPHLKKMGITRIARLTGLDCIGISVSACMRPSAESLSVSQGKGFTDELADVSAVMESIELFHAENSRPPDLRGSYAELSGRYELVRPSRFLPGPFPVVPDTESVIDWVRAEDLLSGRDAYLPHSLIHFDQTDVTPDCAKFQVVSNGLASGNTLQEATCHALYEVIERHSTAEWHKLSEDEQRDLEVQPDTVDGPCRELLEKFAAADIQARVWDASSTIGIPTFVCYIRGIFELRGLATFGGMGTHFSRDVALSRALTEAAQSRLTLISGARDDMFRSVFTQQQVYAADHLPALEEGVGKPFRDCPAPRYGDSFRSNIEDLLGRLEAAGFDRVLRVDHTRSDFNIPVVHVFVPGMEFPPE